MLLTIDCGNTNTIFSIWDGTRFVSTWRTATDHQRTADQYFVWLSTLISLTLDLIVSASFELNIADKPLPKTCFLLAIYSLIF